MMFQKGRCAYPVSFDKIHQRGAFIFNHLADLQCEGEAR
jgi:hypothetical protein